MIKTFEKKYGPTVVQILTEEEDQMDILVDSIFSELLYPKVISSLMSGKYLILRDITMSDQILDICNKFHSDIRQLYLECYQKNIKGSISPQIQEKYNDTIQQIEKEIESSNNVE